MNAKESKRIDAIVRQEEYDALTADEKLARIATRPGDAARERARILAAQSDESGR